LNEFFTTVIAGAFGSQLSTKLSTEDLTKLGIFVLAAMAIFGWVIPSLARKIM